MKKTFLNLILLVCIALLGVACSNSTKLTGNEFLIEGRISGVDDGIVVFLLSERSNTLDTIKNGRFMFKEKALSNPERMGIAVIGEGFPSMYLSVWAAPGAKIKIRGKDKMVPLWEVKSSVSYQKEANRYTNDSRDIIAEIARIGLEYNELQRQRNTVSSDDEILELRKTATTLDARRNSLSVKQLFNDVVIMEKTKTSPIWFEKMRNLSVIVRNSERYDLDDEQTAYLRKKADELYGKFSEDDKNTALGQEIIANLFPPKLVSIGDNFADADLSDINGNTKNLSDYLGKYLLLDFWASWCGPCIMALPEMREIAETYRDNLLIISISLDPDAEWKRAMREHNMPWVNLRDSQSIGGLAAAYGVNSIPNYVLISPEGIIVDKWAGYGTGSLKRKMSENIE